MNTYSPEVSLESARGRRNYSGASANGLQKLRQLRRYVGLSYCPEQPSMGYVGAMMGIWHCQKHVRDTGC